MLAGIICLLNASAQTITPAPAQAPVGFNYQRDFKTILEKTKDKTSDLYYQKLLIRFLNNDSSLTRAEVLALMIGYTEDRHYKPLKDMEKEQEIYDMNEDGDYQGSLDESKIYLQTHPLSLRVLKERSYSYHQLYKKDSAQYFMDLVDKVMGAMIYSGKGKTPETAIFSLGVIDGEHFINNVGMTPAHKSVTPPKTKVLMYIVDALSDEGTHTNYYFILQHARDKMDEDEIGEEPIVKKKPKKEPKKDTKKENKKDSKKDKKDIAPEPEKPVTDSIPPATPPSTTAPVGN